MRHGSLFAGFGGLDIAVEQWFGATTAWVSEVEPAASRILAHHWPDAPNVGDVTTVDWSRVEPVDILSGGSPCQDVSAAGKQAGMTEGTRSNLWVAMREAVAALRPRLVIWENVLGAHSAKASSRSDLERRPGFVGGVGRPNLRATGRVLGDLASLGYDAEWVTLAASDVGACHQRRRVFVVAHAAGDAWWECHRDGRAAADAPSLGGRASGPANGGALGAGGSGGSGEQPVVPVLLPTPAVNDMGRGKTVEWWDEWTDAMKAKHGNGNGHGASLEIEALRLLPTPRASDGAKGGPNQRGSKGDLALPAAVHQFGKYAPVIARHAAVMGVEPPAPTVDNGKGKPRLNPRFVEWMMWLPDGHVTDHTSTTEALKALGNGVVWTQAFEAFSRCAAMSRMAVAA